jgi:hypothetical protein
VNHGFIRGLAGRFMGSERMRMGGVYLMLVEEYRVKAFCEEKKLSSQIFSITNKCVVDLYFGCPN